LDPNNIDTGRAGTPAVLDCLGQAVGYTSIEESSDFGHQGLPDGGLDGGRKGHGGGLRIGSDIPVATIPCILPSVLARFVAYIDTPLLDYG
ncbi:hypothetical protein ABTD29_19785, partial [Acinetobacter baumannii]